MKIIALFFLMTFISSCGLKQIVIPNLDMAIEHKLRQDMQLDYKQQKELAKDVDALLNKLSTPTKKHLAPLLKNFNIENFKSKSKITGAIHAVFFIASHNISQLMAKYQAKLDSRQIQHFFEKFEDQNNQIRKRIKKYNTNLIIQRFEFFIGNLNQKQINIINEFKPEFILRNRKRLELRTFLQTKLKSVYDNYKDADKKEIMFLDIYKEYNALTKEYFYSEATSKAYNMAFKVIQNCDDKQKQRFQSKVETASEWINYFVEHEF